MEDKTPFYFTKTTFNSFVNDLVAKFTAIKTKLSTIDTNINSISNDVVTNRNRITANRSLISSNTSKINSLTESTNQSISSINEKLNQIGDNAEANIINGIIYNNEQLTPDSNKIVTIPPAKKLKIYNTTAQSAEPSAEYDGSSEVIVTALKLFNTTTATLSVDGWSSNEQNVAINGLGAQSLVFVSPDPSSISTYIKNQVYAKVQSTNQLTFTCQKVPTKSIQVQIVYTGT